MERIPVWFAPAVLALIQLAAWPGLPLATGDPLAAPAVATGVATTAVVAVALLWRRRAPAATIAVVIAALSVGTWGTPTDVLLVVSLADLVVLYSVAVLRPHRTTLIIAATAVVWQSALSAATSGVTAEFPAEVLITVVVCAAVAAFGRARRRWYADRAGAASRLAEAEDRRARAADTERHRLARELHDVTAHHLTSIVVIASAAQRLGGTRPDLVAEARAFAARTGRDTLVALQRLVALLQLPDQRPGPAPGRLAELAEGFRLLGQPVGVQAEAGDLPAAVTEAVCGIAREALTNTLRYAAGSGVRIRLAGAPDGWELTVDDDGARADGVPDLGSGRGVAGMRERAHALGGTLTAGPRPGGGWRVRAVLPPPGAPTSRRRRWPVSDHVLDVMVVLLALLLPIGVLLVDEEEPGLTGATVPLLLLAAAAHALPLIWRRRHPWAALTGVALTSALLPALIGTGLVAPELAWIVLAGWGADVIAVYAVARYGRRSGLTALAVVAALAAAAPAAGFLIAFDPLPDDDSPLAVRAVVMSVIVRVPLAVPLAAAWLTGWLVRRRRTGIETREHDAVATSTAQALFMAGVERARVASGLRAAVLRDTARVASAADAGDLDQVLESARAALDAMRGLLNGLRDEPAGDAAGRDPQPTTAALPGLADRWRANGRAVGLEVDGGGRVLPADVDLSAFRVVELLLAGDTGPVTVRVDLTGDPLRIRVRPMPPDEGGEIAAGLRARLAAVGGRVAPAADGQPDIHLPAPAHPDDIRPDEPLPRTTSTGAAAGGTTPPTTGADPTSEGRPGGVGRGSGEGGPADGAGTAAGSISDDHRPGTPGGDDEEVASSPSA